MQIRSFGTLNNILHVKPKHLRKKIPVALLEDVLGVGLAGEVPWVRRGMMRRNLFPSKKALYLDLEGNPIPVFDPQDFSTHTLKNLLEADAQAKAAAVAAETSKSKSSRKSSRASSSSDYSSPKITPDQDPVIIAFRKAQIKAIETAHARKVLAEKLSLLSSDFRLVFERLPIQKQHESPATPSSSSSFPSSIDESSSSAPTSSADQHSLSSPSSLSGSSSSPFSSSSQDTRDFHGSVTVADIKEQLQKDHNIILLEDGEFEQQAGIENNRIKASGVYSYAIPIPLSKNFARILVDVRIQE